ncbi:MAG: hypothetical protein JO216_10330 [Hyphomicrobiales bacterium]|nr:hypothetical protein [Hyphomicrobiales bacterium]
MGIVRPKGAGAARGMTAHGVTAPGMTTGRPGKIGATDENVPAAINPAHSFGFAQTVLKSR